MTRFSRCDGCRTEVAMPFDNGWLVIVHPDKEQCDAHTMTFCSWHCLADYATARALIGDDTDGNGP